MSLPIQTNLYDLVQSFPIYNGSKKISEIYELLKGRIETTDTPVKEK